MGLYNRQQGEFSGVLQDAEDGSIDSSFSVDAGDFVDAEDTLEDLSQGDAEIELFRALGFDPYGEKVEEFANKFKNGVSQRVGVKAGDTLIGSGTFSLEKSGSRDVNASLDFNRSFESVKNSVMDVVKGNASISEEIAKFRGASQVAAGGDFEVDQDIDDFDDALASIGGNTLTFTPLQDSNNDTTMDKTGKMSLTGVGLAVAGFILYKVIS